MTVTLTSTLVPAASVTFTATISPSPTLTLQAATATPKRKKGPPKPLAVAGMPNPQGGAMLTLAVNFESDADSALVEIFTSAMTQVSLSEVRGPFPAGWNQMACPATGMAHGLYYVRVTGKLDNGENAQGKTAKIYRLE